MFDNDISIKKPDFNDVYGECKDGWKGTGSTDNSKSINEISELLTSNFRKNVEIRYTYIDIANQICYRVL